MRWLPWLITQFTNLLGFVPLSKAPGSILNSRNLVLDSELLSEGLIFSLPIIASTAQTNQITVFVHFSACIIFSVQMSCVSFLFLHAARIPDPKNINHDTSAFIVGLTARVYMYFRKSIFDNSIGRLDSESPVNMVKPRFVSKQHIKFLNIQSFSCFDYETVTRSFSLVRLQFVIPRWEIEPKISCLHLYLFMA